MPEEDTMVAVYGLHEDAEAAIKRLRDLGFGAGSFSIAGRNFHTVEGVVGYSTSGGVARPYGKLGPFWNGLLRSFSESALFWVPGLGPLVLAGELVSRVLQASEDNVIVYGLSMVGVALYSMGIPEYSILSCEDALRRDQFVIVAHGNAHDVTRAKEALATSEAESTEIHHPLMPVATQSWYPD